VALHRCLTAWRRAAAPVLAGALLLLPLLAVAAPTVSAVRSWTAPDHTRVVLDLTAEAQYSTRVLTDPDRVVVLIVDGTIGAAPASTPVGDGLVDRVRLNQLQSGAQVVIDLPRASAHDVFFLKPYGDKPHRVVIDVFREGEAAPDHAAATGAAQTEEVETRVVVLDPGHGGDDPGAIGRAKTKEKAVVLDIAKRLQTILESRVGYEVKLTRTGDYFVGLSKRKKLADKAKGDIFISIHGNSAPNHKASGTEIFFVSPRGASDQTARELANRENACDLVGGVSPDADDDVLSILVDLKMSDSVEKSSDMASLVATELREVGVADCTVKQAGFVVLKSLAMPSILVEVGFLSNASDEKELASESYRQKYATSLADGIDAYFARYAPVVASSGQHRVAPGETLWSIARRYDMSVEELRALNNLGPDSTIQVNQILSVKRA
jgi:N-acetylmuramoyl-L-alanine amidase